MNKLLISVEGYLDQLFIELLINNINPDFSNKIRCDNANGIGGVSRSLQKNNYAIGMIDYDKKKPNYFDYFNDGYTSQYLIWKSYTNSFTKDLIIINPAIERFVYDAGDDSGIKRVDYNLPMILKVF